MHARLLSVQLESQVNTISVVLQGMYASNDIVHKAQVLFNGTIQGSGMPLCLL